MISTIKIALAQINLAVGDIDGNLAKITDFHYQASLQGADLIIFPEAAITGYPAEDLWQMPQFQLRAAEAITKLAALTNKAPAIIVGCISKEDNILYNSAFFLKDGQILSITNKQNLPNYGVFDEQRIFASNKPGKAIMFKGITLGIVICEDFWETSPADDLATQQADLLICINASPFERDKHPKRYELALQHNARLALPIIYLNQVGGQDSLVFDGGSFIMSNQQVQAQLPFFQESLTLTTWQQTGPGWNIISPLPCDLPGAEELTYLALMTGLRDYVHKNGFASILLGLSGGIDSALVATIAADCLGSENVHTVMLPYIYTADSSINDAQICASRLGINYNTLDIKACVEAINSSLSPLFVGTKPGLAEENIQSRARGLLLMALSNKFGHLLLTTGNKSELATGYATLYGDMCGGYNPIKDLYKTEVYKLANWRNDHIPASSLNHKLKVISDSIITKEPSAELRANQQDSDSLPPYEILDEILFMLIERQLSISEITLLGHDIKLVEKISKLLYAAEHKRRQSAPGPKISPMSFNLDRRMPITSRWNNK